MIRAWILAVGLAASLPGTLRAQGVLTVFPQTELAVARATAVSFSHDGRLLALGGADGSVRILDAESGRELHARRGGGGAVVGVGFQPSGSRFFVAWENRQLLLVDLISGDAVAELRTAEAIHTLDVSGDGRMVVWGGRNGMVEVLTEGLQPVQRLEAPNLFRKEVRFVRFGLGDREVFAAAEDGRLAWWALGRPDPLRTEELTRQDVVAVARDPGGTVLALGIKSLSVVRSRTGQAGGALVAEAAHTIRILDWERGRALREIEDLPDQVQVLAWTPNRVAVLAGLRDGTLAAWSVDEGRRISTLNQGQELSGVAVSPDGRWIGAVFAGGGGRTWRASGAEAVAQAGRVVQSDRILGQAKFEFTSESTPLIARSERRSVAVLRLAAMGVEEALAGSVSELLTTRMANYPNITSIERGAIEAVLQEVRFQNTGITSAQEAARIGELLNAEVVVLGSLNQLGSSIVISVRMVETESARILGARELVCTECRAEDLPQAVGVLTGSLVQGG